MTDLEKIDIRILNLGVYKLAFLRSPERLRLLLRGVDSTNELQMGALSVRNEENYNAYGFGLYEILDGNETLGLAGILISKDEKGDVCPQIFFDANPELASKELVAAVIDLLINAAFAKKKWIKITASKIMEHESLIPVLEKYGFIKKEQSTYYELTLEDRRLYELSEIIKKEAKSFVPNPRDIAKDLTRRAARLWYVYFSTGIPLSTGGVESNFIQLESFSKHPNLRFFNMYPSDRSGSVVLTQKAMKTFLIEEQAISTDCSSLQVLFCLGSHEGIMRVARCIYRVGKNEGMFFVMSCYGLIATAVSTMEPIDYNVHMVNIDVPRGEKISPTDLEKLAQTHSKVKTLFLELKTMAGGIYTAKELETIISICKKYNLFLIADATHHNMGYGGNTFPDVYKLCQNLAFYEFVIIYTGSKTYGLERARVGFILIDERCKTVTYQRVEDDFLRVLGTHSDLPFEVAGKLLQTPLEERKQYLKNSSEKHRYNMNLMLAYIEGTDSPMLDEDLKSYVIAEIEPRYRRGINGLRVIYKPEGGIHMKIDMSGLQQKFLTNIRMFNSEIFCYALNKMAGVVTLHSYCILDPKGFSLRLSFSMRNDVHRGMQATHNFVSLLSPNLLENKFLPDVGSVETLIFCKQPKKRSDYASFFREKTYQNMVHCNGDRLPHAVEDKSKIMLRPRAKL